MIKADSPYMQRVYQPNEIGISSQRRADLARKSRRMYSKTMSSHGANICAESFAEYHIWRGERIVARDFLTYLRDQAEALREFDSDQRSRQRLALTETLIKRIESLLGEPAAASQDG